MNDHARELSVMLQRVRARWRAAVVLHAWMLASVAAAALLAATWVIDRLLEPGAPALIVLWTAGLLAATASALRLLRPVRVRPDDGQVARFIEERCPELEDTLATAVGQVSRHDDSPISATIAADAARRLRAIDTNRLLAGDVMRRRWAFAAAGTIALIVAAWLSMQPVSRAADAFMAYAFPARLTIEVVPGDVRLRAGTPLRVVARVSGVAGGIEPTLRVREDDGWRSVPMPAGPDGYVASFDGLEDGFRYDVVAAGARSSEYTVTVVHPPAVERIDVQYEYPAGFGLQPRVEEDGGDIYGPAGTKVRLAIHTDKPVSVGSLVLDNKRSVALAAGDVLTGTLTIVADGSYRVALKDADGLESAGETEYFIRTVQDSPPAVHITRPAGDRPVTPLEEVSIEAKADDDFGIAAFDLVYAIRGGHERTLPFRRQPSGQAVTGDATVYLEDLGVRPGDFVSFYARARDVSRGNRSSEARSDMFFLEVKPFEEEFEAATSGAGGGGGQGEDRSLDALIAAQKDVIAATWRLDRRTREARGRADDDVRAVARAQVEVRRRVMSTSSDSQRAAEVRRRLGGIAQAPPADEGGAPLVKAAAAMEQARIELEALTTAKALPHEMAALNELLRAQAEVRRRQVQQQQANNGNGGGGSNRQDQDLSSLFDRELSRQQTNYETPTTAETREQKRQPGDDALEQIRELARRQEAINREHESLAHNAGASDEERRRELERLTREQSELRQQAEELSRQLQRDQPQRQQARGAGQGSESQGERGEVGRALRQASEEMKNAASGLRRQDEQQASSAGQRALGQLRAGQEKAAQARRRADGNPAGPAERRRQIGELQMESRQLADAQRRLGREGRGAESRGQEAVRRRAAEQQRLAERMERLEQSVKDLASAQRTSERSGSDAQRSLGDAARDLDQQKLSERMRDAARQPSSERGGQEAQDIARALDRVGNRLGDASGESAADRQSAEQMARARDLLEQLEHVDRQLSELQKKSGEVLGQRAGTEGRRARSGGATSSPQGRGTGQTGASGAWEQARTLVDKLRQQEDLVQGQRDLAGFNPGLSAPGTEAFKQDFARWEQLKAQVSAVLERIETNAAARLRERAVKGRLNAGRSQAVPDEYRQLVNQYYRSLAGPAPPKVPQAANAGGPPARPQQRGN